MLSQLCTEYSTVEKHSVNELTCFYCSIFFQSFTVKIKNSLKTFNMGKTTWKEQRLNFGLVESSEDLFALKSNYK